MKTYEVLGVVALLALVVLVPIYALREPHRMARAEAQLEDQYVADAVSLYLEDCAICHGLSGEGLGTMPALDNPALASADYHVLFRTIAYAPHGSAMAAWHSAEGGVLNSYQVAGLVALIQSGNWAVVAEGAESAGAPLIQAIESAELAALEPTENEDPHECRACHEEPIVHAERFGLNCARCHTLEAWKPALLLRHTFPLEHGGEGQVACQTCHLTTYGAYTCYGCHDHKPAAIEASHIEAGATEFEACVTCHPTGAPGEAAALQAAESSSSGGDEIRLDN